jgi:uncharacterized membrane protein
MMSEPAQSGKSGSHSAVPLIVSVCLNVALVAMIAVVVATGISHGNRPRWASGPLGTDALMDVASPGEQTRIQAIMDAHKLRLRDLSKQVADSHKLAFRIFASDRFDEPAYAKALDGIRNANDAMQVEVSKMMADAAAQLTPAERARLAERTRDRRKFLWRVLQFRN